VLTIGLVSVLLCGRAGVLVDLVALPVHPQFYKFFQWFCNYSLIVVASYLILKLVHFKFYFNVFQKVLVVVAFVRLMKGLGFIKPEQCVISYNYSMTKLVCIKTACIQYFKDTYLFLSRAVLCVYTSYIY